MKRVSDYIFDYLYSQGVRHAFVMSGGGNIFLMDALGQSKITYVCNHHEQACATAAEGYARTSGAIGVCVVTTGPGGTNAITGALGAWLDSIPMLIISGQVKRELMGSGKGKVRQLGLQEINIVDIVRPMTKYAEVVMNPNDIEYHLEKALYLATHGRPGPVWLDIPLDVQSTQIDSTKLKKFFPKELKLPYETNKIKLQKLVSTALNKLRFAKRPVLYAGNGIHLAHAEREFLELVEMLKIPVLTSYVGYDLIPSTHPLFFGRAHALGQRAANFIVQNSDVHFSLGSRLDILTVGFTYKAFARNAYKIMVDIDRHEIEKHILSVDLPINFDAKDVICEMIRQLKKSPMTADITSWHTYGKRLNKMYPVVLPEYWKEKKFVNYYCFIETLGKLLKPKEIIVESNGVGPMNCMYQAFHVKKDQRIILNLGCAQMGYGLPAAIGASFAVGKQRRIICLEGDGSLQMNIHELEVMKYHALPIKLFVFSNDGYLSIRNSQKGLFESRWVASNAQSGVSCPDYVKLGKAYGIKTLRINSHHDMEKIMRQALAYPGPILVDINALRDMPLTFKLQTKKLPDGRLVSPALEDMGPFLSKEEMLKNMFIPLWKEE